MSTATLETRELTNLDRCDACGAQAYVRVVMASGNELYFCGHHARENEEALKAVASHWDDQTDRLS
ncbi:DUF7455 domain-containing protein [Rothia aerolata]|uniref:DUF7455 domain-containing protein n=1 Tax=Rothia aerolata TaxID=1812262 RepID=A0A917ILA7_9MICC|nr:hypothetical protein [Rothia aerolata]GGH56662.1 hypothetical protein GCM10007359_00990 [Rothia aerolata]